MRSLLSPLVVVLTAACGPFASSRPPPPPPADGDPPPGSLPEGAVARIGTPEFHSGPARALAYVAAGQVMMISPDDDRVTLWDDETGRLLAEVRAPADAAAFSADGQRVARVVRGGDTTVLRLSSFPSDTALAERPLHLEATDGDVEVQVLADGRVAVFTTKINEASGCVQLHGRKLEVLERICPDGEFIDQVLSPDGRHLALLPSYVDPAPQIRVLAVPSGEEVQAFPVGHVTYASVAFSSDGRRFAFADQKDVRAFAVDGWRPQVTATVDGQRTLQLVLEPSQRYLLAGDGDVVTTVALDSGAALGEVRLEPRGVEPAIIAASPDGERIAFVRHGGLFQASTGGGAASPLPDFHIIEGAALSPDGRTVAFTGADDQLCFHDAGDGRKLRCMWEELGHELAFLPDSSAVVAADRHALRIIPVDPRREARTFDLEDPELGGTVVGFAMSPDGTLVAAGVEAEDGQIAIVLVELATGTHRQRLVVTRRAAEATWIDAMSFSRDGTQLAFAIPSPSGNNSVVRVFDVATGQLIAHPILAVMMPRWVAVHADGNIAAGDTTETDFRTPAGVRLPLDPLILVSDDGGHAVIEGPAGLALWSLDQPTASATALPRMPGTLHGIAPAACRALTCTDAQLCYVWKICEHPAAR